MQYSKTCIKRPLNNRQNKDLNDKWKLNEGQCIAEYSPWSILQYFSPALSDNWSWKPICGIFESGHLRQVLLYMHLCPNTLVMTNLCLLHANDKDTD